MDGNDNNAKLELPDEKHSVEIIEKILKRSGLKYRRIKPGEKGGFYYRDKFGRRVRFEGNIFMKRLELMEKTRKRERTTGGKDMKVIDNANDNTVGSMEYGIPFDMQDPKRDAGETVLAMKVLTKEGRGLIISVKTGREIANANMSGVARPYKNAAVVLDKDNDARGLPRSDHKNIEAPRDTVY